MTTRAFAYITDRGFHLRGFVGAALLGGGTLVVACSSPWWRLDELTRAALTALGWASFVVGAGVRCWATLYVGGHKVGGRRENVLTTDGPYSVCRNPLYLGSLLIGLAAALLLQSLTVLAAVGVAALHYWLVTVPAEEAFLRRTVGPEAFDDYCRRTPRFLPNLRLYRSPAEVPVYVKAVRNEARRLLRLSAVPIGLTLLGAARYADVWPAWFRLP